MMQGRRDKSLTPVGKEKSEEEGRATRADAHKTKSSKLSYLQNIPLCKALPFEFQQREGDGVKDQRVVVAPSEGVRNW
jgi:hypothetical protein